MARVYDPINEISREITVDSKQCLPDHHPTELLDQAGATAFTRALAQAAKDHGNQLTYIVYLNPNNVAMIPSVVYTLLDPVSPMSRKEVRFIRYPQAAFSSAYRASFRLRFLAWYGTHLSGLSEYDYFSDGYGHQQAVADACQHLHGGMSILNGRPSMKIIDGLLSLNRAYMQMGIRLIRAGFFSPILVGKNTETVCNFKLKKSPGDTDYIIEIPKQSPRASDPFEITYISKFHDTRHTFRDAAITRAYEKAGDLMSLEMFLHISGTHSMVPIAPLVEPPLTPELLGR